LEHEDEVIRSLETKADVIRRDILSIFESSRMGHAGGSMSLVEIVTALYFHHLRYNPRDPDDPNRDRVVLSKAHCCEALYAALVEIGWFPRETLGTYYHFGSPFQGHADRWSTPGIEYSGGSLGQGLSYAAGLALAEKMKASKKPAPAPFPRFLPGIIVKPNPTFRTYCILGDGECHEGQVWEAAMFATKYRLDNLIAIVDYNKFCLDGPTADVLPIEPFADKWRTFGWWAIEIDGHNLGEIVRTLDLSARLYGDGRPKCIIAHTVKGHGVSTWEDLHTHVGRGDEITEGVKEGRAKYG
jgi:transketolase